MDDQRAMQRCEYIDVCYMAEGLHCYGYKLDCVLYKESTAEPVSEADFHEAIDRLIKETQRQHSLPN